MSEKVVCFRITFKNSATWADETYLGNMLTEVLGTMAKNTLAFEFKIEKLPEGTAQDNGSIT